jgi:hypothetical protein
MKKTIAAVVLTVILAASAVLIDGQDVKDAARIVYDRDAAKDRCIEILYGDVLKPEESDEQDGE